MAKLRRFVYSAARTVLSPGQLPTNVFCLPHRTRLGQLVPARHVVAGEAFCSSCFEGEPLLDLELADSAEPKRAPKGKKSSLAYFNHAQLMGLLAKAKSTRERDWILMLVCFWHGLRASEAVNLRPENFIDGCIAVDRRGGSLQTVQRLVHHDDPLLDERAAIERWLKQHYAVHGDAGRDRRLFPISRVQFFRLMKRYGRLARIPGHLCHPHALRHSIARQMGIEAVRGKLGAVRGYLGHT